MAINVIMPKKSILWSFDLVDSGRVWFNDEGILNAVMRTETATKGNCP